jgi:hypothetical protein
MNVLVSGGYFDASGEGVLWSIDLTAGRAEVVLRHRPEARLHVPGKGFAGAAWSGVPGSSDLLVCGFNALYRVSVASWRVDGVLHQPCMNDLHHVAVVDDLVHVVNTGLDSVDVFRRDGSFVGAFGAGPAWLQAARLAGVCPSPADWDDLLRTGWRAASAEVAAKDSPPGGSYYGARSRLERSFHQRVVRDYLHPNHVAGFDRRLLCTRLADSRVVDLRTFETVIEDLPGPPHDGLFADGRLWLTCVGGQVVEFEPSAELPWRQASCRDVVAATGRSGWCRGLHVTADLLVVGLTEIREPSCYRWRDLPLAGTETSILALDRATGRLLQRVDLTDRARHSKIYSVLPS